MNCFNSKILHSYIIFKYLILLKSNILFYYIPLLHLCKCNTNHVTYGGEVVMQRRDVPNTSRLALISTAGRKPSKKHTSAYRVFKQEPFICKITLFYWDSKNHQIPRRFWLPGMQFINCFLLRMVLHAEIHLTLWHCKCQSSNQHAYMPLRESPWSKELFEHINWNFLGIPPIIFLL